MEKISGITLPLDVYTNHSERKLIYKLINGFYFLYSNGKNLKDDNGSFDDDIVLLYLPNNLNF